MQGSRGRRAPAQAGLESRVSPNACPIAIAMRRAVLGALATLGARQRRHLHLHQLPTSFTDSRSTSGCSSTSTGLTTSSIVVFSLPATRRASLSPNREKSDEHEGRGGRKRLSAPIRSTRSNPRT